MRALALLAANAAAFWPSLHWAAQRTRFASDDRQELVALAACVACVVAWAARGGERRDASLALPAVVLAACAAGALVAPPLVGAALAALSLVCTASVLLAGRRLHVGLLGLALLALPVLPLFELHLSLPARLVAGEGAAALLRASGQEVVAVGAALEGVGPDGAVARAWVDPPCAGLRMVWTGLLAAFGGATLWGLRNAATLAGAALALAAAVAANALRAASLYLLETRALDAPEWGHSAVGVVVQLAAVLAVLLVLRPRGRPACAAPSPS